MNKLFNYFLALLFISCAVDSGECCDEEIIQEVFQDLGFDKPYTYNNIYYGRNKYIEFHPGSLPIIISAPHGGNIIPSEIPDRTYGTMVTDSNTKELTLAIKNAFLLKIGKTPYVIINNLKRTKFDANRDSIEGAQGNLYARRAWEEFKSKNIKLRFTEFVKTNESCSFIYLGEN